MSGSLANEDSSITLRSTMSTGSPERFVRGAAEKSSIAVTRELAAHNSRTRFMPIKPAPPVTKAVLPLHFTCHSSPIRKPVQPTRLSLHPFAMSTSTRNDWRLSCFWADSRLVDLGPDKLLVSSRFLNDSCEHCEIVREIGCKGSSETRDCGDNCQGSGNEKSKQKIRSHQGHCKDKEERKEERVDDINEELHWKDHA